MAGTIGFGGTGTSTTMYTDNYFYTSVGLPTGRAAANGTGYALLKWLAGYCSGRGATRTVVLSLGSAVTSAFSVGAAGSAASTGAVGCSNWLVAGGSATFTVDMSASAYSARGGGGTSYDGYGGSYGGTLGGSYYYTESPSQPISLSAATSPTLPGQIDLSWAAPIDNGGETVTGYRVEYSTDPTFATGVTAVNVAGTTTSITGLTPGSTYYFRIAAKNAVTTAAGTWSVYSSTASAIARSGMKVWNGTAYVPASVRVWDGAAFVPGTIRVWDGAAFVSAL